MSQSRLSAAQAPSQQPSTGCNTDSLPVCVQARFTQAILKQKAGIDFPMDRIFSSTVSGQPKSEVLEMLRERHAGLDCHFVEDKLSTLRKVMKVDALGDVQLYLVDWGYNTDEEKQFARESERIELIGHERFGSLLTGQ